MTYRALVAIFVFLLTIASAQNNTASNSNPQLNDGTSQSDDAQNNSTSNSNPQLNDGASQPDDSTSQESSSTATEAEEEEDKYADYSFDCLVDADGNDILGNT